MSGEERIALPDDIIPKKYIGEKFGVLLVFVKGRSMAKIKRKVKKLANVIDILKKHDEEWQEDENR